MGFGLGELRAAQVSQNHWALWTCCIAPESCHADFRKKIIFRFARWISVGMKSRAIALRTSSKMLTSHILFRTGNEEPHSGRNPTP